MNSLKQNLIGAVISIVVLVICLVIWNNGAADAAAWYYANFFKIFFGGLSIFVFVMMIWAGISTLFFTGGVVYNLVDTTGTDAKDVADNKEEYLHGETI